MHDGHEFSDWEIRHGSTTFHVWKNSLDELTTYFLEMSSPADLVPRDRPDGLTVTEAQVKDFRFNRYLYQLVGEQWNWVDKLPLSDKTWAEYAESDDLRTWVAYNRGSIAGYYELQKLPNDEVKITYFGLAPKFIGCGYGGYLLYHAIKTAWEWGNTRRVWVHTCTDDHPNALANYVARGLRVYRTVYGRDGNQTKWST
jgi:GNAT superfamily N-acetyltransferase